MKQSRVWLLVAVVALAAMLPALRNGFVYDDVPAVADDARIRELSPRLLAMPYWGDEIRDRLYRPFTTASFAIDHAAGGGGPLAFHLTNVLLHVVVALLVFALARRLLESPVAALVAALWFAVHPVHVEPVANVVGRSELLAAAGYLGAVLAWAAEGDAAAAAPAGRRRALLAVLVLACTALAFGAKEHALTLPAALVLMDIRDARRRAERPAAALRRHALLFAAVLAVAAGYLAARAAVLGTAFGGGAVGAGLEGLDAPARAMVMTPALLVWARLLVFPAALSADYSPAHFQPLLYLSWQHAAAVMLLVGVATLAWGLRRRAPALGTGLIACALTAFVATNVPFATGVMLAERTLYLPSVGAAVAVGALWSLLPPARVVWPLTAAALALLAARTLSRIEVWRDSERFYQALVSDAPGSYRAWWAQGARAFEQSRPADGERAFLKAIETWPSDGAVIQELGEHYLSAGLWAPADRFLTAAFRVDSLRSDAAVQAVLARIRLGRADSAAALGAEALRRFPTAPTLLFATADARLALGDTVGALTLRRRAVYAHPGVWQHQHIAAVGAALAGLCDEARRRAARAAELAPGEAPPRALRDSLRDDAPRCGVQP